MEFDKEFLRWLLMIGAAPIWAPFILTLWRDFNRALREEGGLFGREPGPHLIEKLRRERAGEPDLLLSEPWVRHGERRRPSLGAGGRSVPPPPSPKPRFRSGPASGGPRPHGFR